MRKRIAFVMALFVSGFAAAACVPPPPPYTPSVQKTTEDPDKLYAAGVRVLLRRGYGFASRDADARAIETDWRVFQEMGLPDQEKWKVGKIRIIVSRDHVEISTECAVLDEGKLRTDGDWGQSYCKGSVRPYGVPELEQAIVKDMIAETETVGGGKLVRGTSEPSPPPPAPPPATPPPTAGCTKDTDCKGDRICVRGECTAP